MKNLNAILVHLAIAILKKASFLDIQKAGFHFQSNDFYSPLNDCEFLMNNMELWKNRPPVSGIDWNVEGQLETAKKVSQYVEELRMSLKTKSLERSSTAGTILSGIMLMPWCIMACYAI